MILYCSQWTPGESVDFGCDVFLIIDSINILLDIR